MKSITNALIMKTSVKTFEIFIFHFDWSKTWDDRKLEEVVKLS